jgi:hypothetical protein
MPEESDAVTVTVAFSEPLNLRYPRPIDRERLKLLTQTLSEALADFYIAPEVTLLK